jgi:hypothetical protein
VVDLVLRAAIGRTFHSLEHLNEVTAWWLAEGADVQVHGTTQKWPIDLHAAEQPRLILLPAAPYEVADVVYRTVDAEGYVNWQFNASCIDRVQSEALATGEFVRRRDNWVLLGRHQIPAFLPMFCLPAIDPSAVTANAVAIYLDGAKIPVLISPFNLIRLPDELAGVYMEGKTLIAICLFNPSTCQTNWQRFAPRG